MPHKTASLDTLVAEIRRLPSDWALCACNGSKAPLGDGWQETPLTAEDFDQAAQTGRFQRLSIQPKSGTREAFNPPSEWCKAVGVLCGEPSGGLLFFDHDGKSCDDWIREHTNGSLKDALPPSPVVSSGRTGRYQIIYRVAESEWSNITTTKKRTGMVGEDGKPEQIELRWTGCQSVVLGEHPNTTGYRWVHHPQDKPVAAAPDWMINLMRRDLQPAATQPRLPLGSDDAIPLRICCAPVTRKALEGTYDGGRNDAGIAIARDLIGTAAHLDAIAQPYIGHPETMFHEWCSMVGLDTDTPLGQPEAIWRSATRKATSPALQPEMIEGCIRAYKRRKSQNESSYPQGGYTPAMSRVGVSNDAKIDSRDSDAEIPEVERLKLELQLYRQESDPFERVLLENGLSTEFRVNGKRLSTLLEALNPAPLSEFERLDDLSAEVFAQIEDRAESGVVPGYLTGFTSLDAIIQGFQAGDLIILAARPSMGKTGLACNIARQLAEIHDGHVAIFSLEMSKHQLFYRLLSSESKIESQVLRKGNVSDNQWPNISAALGNLSALNISIDDSSILTVSQVRRKVEKLIEKVGPLTLVVIDYLQLLVSETGFDSRALEVAAMTRELKCMARDIGVPILVLSQLSRALESRPKADRRPVMSDLRDSGGIEQDADLIMMLYRPEYYDPQTIDKGIAEVNVVKNRNGPIGTARLNFSPELVKFENLTS